MKPHTKKEKTREHLLRKAYEAFAEKGILATKTLNIAQAAGVSHGSLFAHFPTREELLIRVIDEFGVQIERRFQELIANKGTAAEILAAHLDIIREYEAFYSHLVVEGSLLPKAVRNRIFLIQSGIAHYLEKALAGRKELPIHFLLNSWLGLIHYYLSNRELFAPGKSVIEVCGKELHKNFIQTFQI